MDTFTIPKETSGRAGGFKTHHCAGLNTRSGGPCRRHELALRSSSSQRAFRVVRRDGCSIDCDQSRKNLHDDTSRTRALAVLTTLLAFNRANSDRHFPRLNTCTPLSLRLKVSTNRPSYYLRPTTAILRTTNPSLAGFHSGRLCTADFESGKERCLWRSWHADRNHFAGFSRHC